MKSKKIKFEDIIYDNYRETKDIAPLAKSIKANGLMFPLVVEQTPSKAYKLVDGGRRYMAIKSIIDSNDYDGRFDELTCNISNKDSGVTRLLSNYNRRKPTFSETASLVSGMLMNEYSNQDIADLLGISVSHVKAYSLYDCLTTEAKKKLNIEEMTASDRRLSINRMLELNEIQVVETAILQETFFQRERESDLSRAIFDTTDEDLYVEMGACTTCQYNTDKAIELFGISGKCLYSSCYEKKSILAIHQKLRIWVDKGNYVSAYWMSDVVEHYKDHYIPNVQLVYLDDIEDYFEFDPPKEGSKASFYMINVEGEDVINKETFVDYVNNEHSDKINEVMFYNNSTTLPEVRKCITRDFFDTLVDPDADESNVSLSDILVTSNSTSENDSPDEIEDTDDTQSVDKQEALKKQISKLDTEIIGQQLKLDRTKFIRDQKAADDSINDVFETWNAKMKEILASDEITLNTIKELQEFADDDVLITHTYYSYIIYMMTLAMDWNAWSTISKFLNDISETSIEKFNRHSLLNFRFSDTIIFRNNDYEKLSDSDRYALTQSAYKQLLQILFKHHVFTSHSRGVDADRVLQRHYHDNIGTIITDEYIAHYKEEYAKRIERMEDNLFSLDQQLAILTKEEEIE